MRCDQGFHDECGIFGVFDHTEAANITYLGLYALQHRGQESAGIASTDGNHVYVHRGMGYVADIFNRMNLSELVGFRSIGHVRYSTQGDSFIRNAQPVVVSCWRGPIAISHNGNLVNALELRRDLEKMGSIFQTTSDSEVIVHLIAKTPDPDLIQALKSALLQIKGAYSLLVMTRDYMIGVRDPHGFRPLVLGDLNGSPVLASETCALDLINASFVREIEPGEMVVIGNTGMVSHRLVAEQMSAHCIFELIYFARPDSIIFNRSVYK
ncbi:amidophosphoribosyltransferase, partial [bacterium]|nr:amidophosphoribosyltransferase [candidate division CSSED10-310 bacterium]